uniref:GOLD domain-containing protein n=1 Tax=Gossypium raimondii TaxID=29730 RepID=A0A0D2TUT9_GOSRA|nr:hypothetical protein B456_009G325400 [Gossypium raimondii]
MILRSVIMVVVGILSSASQALRFELQSGHTKCISEDIKSNSMTVGKYHVVNPNEAHPLPDSLKFAVRVTSPQGNSLHTAEKVETGQFAFTAAEDGDYMACFWAEDHSPQIIMTVDFDWRSGVQAKDWSNVAKKGQVDVSLFCFSLLLTPTINMIGMSHKIIKYQTTSGSLDT